MSDNTREVTRTEVKTVEKERTERQHQCSFCEQWVSSNEIVRFVSKPRAELREVGSKGEKHVVLARSIPSHTVKSVSRPTYKQDNFFAELELEFDSKHQLCQFCFENIFE